VINIYEKSLESYVLCYASYFRCGNHSKIRNSIEYISGLLHDGKSNIEKMEEQVLGSDYQRLHHFISESPWDAQEVIREVSLQVHLRLSALEGCTGLLFDESGWEKSGKKSVGVARQYIGNVGKVCNSVNGVFACLTRGSHVGLIGGRLYLPESWTSDIVRCSNAGIPLLSCVYKSKPELAMEIHQNLSPELSYDWVGGDAIYGNSPTFRHYLEDLGQTFVMDVGSEKGVYLSDPKPFIPPRKDNAPGPSPTKYQTLEKSVILKDLIKQIEPNQWETIVHRKGTKGNLIRRAVILNVWVWNPEFNDKVEKLQLIISTETDGTEAKFSLCYQKEGEITLEKALFWQMQRYFVERAFQNAKTQLGMHQYQVRSWKAWYHHIALTFMALDFLLKMQIEMQPQIPLISCPDVKLMLAKSLNNKLNTPQGVANAIKNRHIKRQKDMKRAYKAT
jgi:SRSO17 transposase